MRALTKCLQSIQYSRQQCVTFILEPGHTSIKCNVRSERLAGSFARGKWKSKMDDADILNAGVHTCPMSVRGTSWVLQM